MPIIWAPIGLQRAIQLNGAVSIPGIARIAAGPGVGHLAAFSLQRFALMALVLTMGIAANVAQSPLATSALIHKKAPEFVRRDLNRRRLDLNGYRGKVVLLNFWATWCAPCQVEMPSFVGWEDKYGPRGLQVIGISMDDDPALVHAAYRKLKLNYPVAMGDVKLGDLYGGVLGLPMTFLIDRHGEIIAEFQGETDLNRIETQLQSLLSGH